MNTGHEGQIDGHHFKSYVLACSVCKTWRHVVEDDRSNNCVHNLESIGALVSTRCFHGHHASSLTAQEFCAGGDAYAKYTEWTDESRRQYETPPRTLVPGEIFCKPCRSIITLDAKTIDTVEERKKAGKAMIVICVSCGTKHCL